VLLMPVTQWIRWQCAYATNPRTLLLSWESAALFPHLIAWAKIQGYDPDEGLDPRYFQPRVLSRALFGAPEPVTVTCVTEWTDAGLIYEKGGNVYIKGFRKWQPDPTAVDRKRRQREREKDVTEVTGTSVSHADGTGRDGTVREGTKEREKNPPTPQRGARGNGGPRRRRKATQTEREKLKRYIGGRPADTFKAVVEQGFSIEVCEFYAREGSPHTLQDLEDASHTEPWAAVLLEELI